MSPSYSVEIKNSAPFNLTYEWELIKEYFDEDVLKINPLIPGTPITIITQLEIAHILAKQSRWESNEHVLNAFKRVLDKIEPHQYNQLDTAIIDLAIIMITLYKIHLDNGRSTKNKYLYENAFEVYKNIKPVNATLYANVYKLREKLEFMIIMVAVLAVFAVFIIPVMLLIVYANSGCAV